MFVGVHSTVLGPAVGGTRMRVYPTPADGLARRAAAVGGDDQKLAGAGMPRGGGKAVLAVPELPTGEARQRLLRRYGELVASLGGTYRTAGDMNIKPEDLDVVAETCPWVYGATGRGGNSGPGTARGVFHAIRATVEHVFGSPELAGRRVLVQGAGAVGANLARELAEAGARVLVSDVDEARAAATGCETVAPDAVFGFEVDVFAPCAVGAILNSETIPLLNCRAVAGGANNQLAEPADAERLRERGILFAPDYVVNSGGMIYLIGLEDEGGTRADRRGARGNRRDVPQALRRSRCGRRHAERGGRPTVRRRLAKPHRERRALAAVPQRAKLRRTRETKTEGRRDSYRSPQARRQPTSCRSRRARRPRCPRDRGSAPTGSPLVRPTARPREAPRAERSCEFRARAPRARRPRVGPRSGARARVGAARSGRRQQADSMLPARH